MSKVYAYNWHNDKCQRTQEYIDQYGHKRFFCVTHNQWASEVLVKRTTVFEYGDGSTHLVTEEMKQRIS